MSVKISTASVVGVVATGQSDVLIPIEKVRELVLSQKPVEAPFGAFTVKAVDMRLEKGNVILKFECSGDVTVVLGVIPLPQARAAVAANELLGRPVSLDPSFVVETALEPYLVADTRELFAPVADFTVVKIKPLNGLPLDVGNLITRFISGAVGKTFSVTGSTVRGAGNVAGRTVAAVTRPVRNTVSKVGRGLSRVVPKRFRRSKEESVAEAVVIQAAPETVVIVEAEAKVEDMSRFASLILKLLNFYLQKRPLLVLPDEYNGIPIAGLVRWFEVEEEGIRVFFDVNHNPTLRKWRTRALAAVLLPAGGICTEWFFTGSFLWF